MPDCPTCGKHLEESVRFCPDDGTPVTETAVATPVNSPTGTCPPSRELELPVLLGNRYRLVECRGGGGMARVYRATDITLEREVAVKLINPELRQDPEFDSRFQREARIASQLADPHIVVVHDFGIDPTHGPFLVMEYLQGQTLREHLQSRGPLPLKAVLQMSAQLLLALIHAHEKGIVHRDIKPDNIFLLNQSGVRLHVRVLDFGIARIFRRDEPGNAETLTRPGAVLGTPRYMSPEQLAGQAVDLRSDLYSAALVIFESLTGTLPYVSPKKLVELCPDSPAALQSIVEQCLQQASADRPGSAVEVYLRLQEPCKASGVLYLPPGAMDKFSAAAKAAQATVAYQPPQVAPPWWRRRLTLVVAAAFLLLAGGIWALTIDWHRSGIAGPGNQETVHLLSNGLTAGIGCSRDDLVAWLKQPDGTWSGDPWKWNDRELIGHTLKPEDLENDGGLDDLEVLSWSKEHCCVVLRRNVARAIIIHEPARATSGLGVRVNDHETHLKHLYREKPDLETLDVPAVPKSGARSSKWIEVYRYNRQGIGFEVQEEKVKTITLFPPS